MQRARSRAGGIAAPIVIALALFASFLMLGSRVTRFGEPAFLVPVETTLRGHSVLLAWWFTWLGYVEILAPLMLACVAVAWRYRAQRVRALLPVVLAVIAWQVADLFQRFYHRPRQPHWFVRHETAFSYPSSHAAIAVAFYALGAYLVATSGLRRSARVPLALLLAVLAAGIVWARLALGAHYITDVTGGALLAVSLVALAVALLHAAGVRLSSR